jgi:crotonobetainyl-CoA:carnitine CoA-transferase CaiB-like acyl-CoA transferase
LIIVAVVAAVVDRLVLAVGRVLHTWEAVQDPHISVAGHWEEVQ